MVTAKPVGAYWTYSASSVARDSSHPLTVEGPYTDRPATRRWVPALATLLSSTIGNVLAVMGTALLLRMLGGEAFGKAALLTSAAITLGTVTSSGICLHILRTTARVISEEEIRAQVWIGMIVGQFIAALITVGLLIMGLIQDERSLFEYLLTGLSLHFTTSDALSKNRLIGGQRLMPLAGATIFGSISTVGLQLLGAWMEGPPGYMIGFALGTGLQAVSSWLACQASLPAMGVWPQGILRRMRDRELLEFVTLGTLSACVVPLAHWVNSLIAANKMNSYSEVATLTVAMQFFNMVIFVPTILNKIVLPKTIKDDSNRNVDDSRREAGRKTWKMVLHTAPMLLAVWALSGPITAIYRFPTPDGIAVILCFVGASVLACAAIPLSNYFVSHSKMKRGLVGNLLWAATYLGLAWALPGGAISTATGLLCAYALNLFIALYLVKASHNAQ
jgi:O-antigen/teichoic acid export membrane protein